MKNLVNILKFILLKNCISLFFLCTVTKTVTVSRRSRSHGHSCDRVTEQ